jgi:hypothetical protein
MSSSRPEKIKLLMSNLPQKQCISFVARKDEQVVLRSLILVRQLHRRRSLSVSLEARNEAS